MRIVPIVSIVVAAAACGVVLGASGARGSGNGSATSAGERLYRQGKTASGGTVRATLLGDLDVSSDTMPCANCHKRSGWGTTEGPLTTPPVVGRVIFGPVTLGAPEMGLRTSGPGTRPAYDDLSLARAIREGVDPAGRTLAPAMPRYQLGAGEVQALAAYLRTLGAEAAPGVSSTTIHLATITTPDTDPDRQEAMRSVLRSFVDARNAGSRNEARRRDHGPWDMKSRYDLYRHWELHEWRLTGDASAWEAQLSAFYAAQPVFAVVGGIGDGDWSPVHRFCESAGIPCVLPQTPWPLAEDDGSGFYSVYFSPGLTTEAELIASFVRASGSGERPADVRQIARCGSAGAHAMRLLTRRLGGSERPTPCVDAGSAPIASGRWRSLLAGAPPLVVAWVGDADLEGLGEALAGSGQATLPARIVVSASLAGERLLNAPPSLRSRLYVVTPFVPPSEFERHAMRSLVWLKSRGLAGGSRDVAVNAFFAISVVADALATPRAAESRDYFLEQIEHMVGRSPVRSAYPSLTLGPGRRFASLGGSVFRLPGDAGNAFPTVVPWTVPESPRR